jgi:hypothetical protein
VDLALARAYKDVMVRVRSGLLQLDFSFSMLCLSQRQLDVARLGVANIGAGERNNSEAV